MKRFSEQFYTKSQSVTLQPAEKKALKERVVSYMGYHPLPEIQEKSVGGANWFWFNKVFFNNQLVGGIAVLVCMVGVSVFAESSVPGDALYAVKVQVNEEVISTLTINQYEKIEWETERLNRRIAEARVLASEGKLTDEIELSVAEAVREHTTDIQNEIAQLRTEDVEGATLASLELTTTLEMQAMSLREEGRGALASVTAEATEQSTTMVMAAINEGISSTEANNTDDIPGFDKVMARMEMNTTRSYELFQSLSFDEGDGLKGELERRLSDLSRSIEEAKTTRNRDENKAGEILLAALERSSKLIVYMSDVSVNRKVALDTVVPVILTKEEQEQKLALANNEIERKIKILETLRPSVSSAVAAKIDHSVKIATTKQNNIEPEAAEPQLAAADTVALLDDTLRLVEAEGVSIAATTVSSTTTATASEVASTTKSGE